VLGIVLGIALRGIIADFFSGIALELDPPFKIGDYVELRMGGDPVIGRVTEVNWRATQIVPRDSTNTVYVPNSLMSSIAVNNVYRPLGQTRFELFISFDPGIPHDRVLRVLMSAAMSTEGISKDFLPEIAASKYNSSGVEYIVRYWLKPETSPTGARTRLMAAIMDQTKRSDLQVAFPRQEVVFEPKPAAITDHLAFKTAFLERNAFFRSCLPEELKNIATHMHTRQYPPGTTIVTMGETGNSMFLVSEGLVEVSLPNGGGHKLVVGKLLAGDFFGEMSMLTDDPRSATVTTLTEAVLYEIRRQHIHDLVRDRPEIAEGMSHVAARRRLENQQAELALDTEEPTEEHRNLKAIIWGKMRSLFGWHKNAGADPPPPQSGGANA
jgi:CRP-like cAMP-binding protein